MTDRLAASLADRYRIERELGQGGMATVYLAHDVRHDRKVALKVLRPELSAILGAERFLAEIKTTANLQHPHILSLYDSGEADGLVFYVMPYVEGESLRDRGVRSEDLAWIPADGSAPAESLVVAEHDQAPGDFTPDGRTMVIREQPSGAKRRISVVALDSARAPRPLIAGAFESHSPSLSPDGRWVAYVSDESGRNEVYVRPFPGPGGRWQVSRDGGVEPRWSGTGREIFFRSSTSIMSASVQAGATFAPGDVRELFRTSALLSTVYANYDVSRDGRTFILAQPLRANDQAVVVLLNWFENLPVRTR